MMPSGKSPALEAAVDSRSATGSRTAPSVSPGVRVSSDELAGEYSSMVSEGGSAKEKEASMLFSIAEGHLAEDNNFEEAFQSASDAMRHFEEAKSSRGVVDSRRLMIHALRAKADNAQYASDPRVRNSAKDDLAKAEEMATSELSRLKASGDRRGQACMLLAQAEVLAEKRDMRSIVKAIPMATEAADIFAEIVDKKMEGVASETAANLCTRTCDFAKAQQRIDRAVALFQEIEQGALLAKALHTQGYVLYCAGDTAAGLEAAKASLAKYTELAQQKGQALQHYLIAQLLLLRPSTRSEALSHAQQALSQLRSLSSGKTWQAAALTLTARAMLARDQVDEAAKLLQDSMRQLKSAGDQRGEVIAADMLIQVYLQQENYTAARQVADSALQTSTAMGDKAWEAICTSFKAETRMNSEEWDDAEELAKKAVQIADDLKDPAQAAAVKDTLINVLFARKAYTEAGRVANQQRDTYRDCGELAKEAFALMNAALAKSMGEQDPEGALDAAYEAELLARKSKDKRALAAALRMLSQMHMANGSYDGALRTARQSRTLWQEMSEEVEEISTLRSICEIYLFRGRPADCITWATEGEEIAKKAGYELGQCEMYLLIASGNLHAIIKDGEKADDVYGIFKKKADLVMSPADKALSIAERLRNKGLQASARFTLAQGLLYSEKAEPAVKALQEAESLFADMKDAHGQSSCAALASEALYVVDKESQSLESAKRALDLAREVKDQVWELRAADMLTKITGEKVAVAGAEPVKAAASSVAVVEEGGGGMDMELVQNIVLEMAKASTGLDESDLAFDAPLMEVGMDSLSSVQFRNDLVKETGLALPASLMFDYPSMREITEQIVEMTRSVNDPGDGKEDEALTDKPADAAAQAAADAAAPPKGLDYGIPVQMLPAYGRENGVGYYQPGFYKW